MSAFQPPGVVLQNWLSRIWLGKIRFRRRAYSATSCSCTVPVARGRSVDAGFVWRLTEMNAQSADWPGAVQEALRPCRTIEESARTRQLACRIMLHAGTNPVINFDHFSN